MQPTPDLTPLRWETTEYAQLFQTPLTPELVAWRLEAQKQVRTPTGATKLEPVVREGIAHRDDIRAWAQHGQGVPDARAKWVWLSDDGRELLRHYYFGDDALRPLWRALQDQQPWTMLRDTPGGWPGRLCCINYGNHEVRDALTNQRLPQATELNEIYLNWCERDMDLQAFRRSLMGRTDIRWASPRFTSGPELAPGDVPEPWRNHWDDDGDSPDSAGRYLRGTWIPSDDAWTLVQEGLSVLAATGPQDADEPVRRYDQDRILRVLDVFGADQFLRPDLRGEAVLAKQRTHPQEPLSDQAYAQLLRIRAELRQLPIPRTPLRPPAFAPDAPVPPGSTAGPKRRAAHR